MSRPRVLLMAYACRPNEGSEPGLGWNRAIGASQNFDTWVICNGTRCQAAIDKYLADHGKIPGLHFEYVPETPWQKLCNRLPGGFYPGYTSWQRAAYARAKVLHEEVGFDLVHQTTYCGYREPGYAWQLPVPFVWGGIGGSHNYPTSFLREAGWAGGASELLRSVVNTLQFRFSGHFRKALKASALTMSGNTLTQRHLREIHGIETDLFPASGIGDVTGQPRERRDDDEIRLLWCGYLHPLKGLSLLLRALSQLPAGTKYKLRVVGRGPMLKSWQRLAKSLGVADHVEFVGWIPHHEALQQYHWADVFVCTSLRETLPGVVLESLAAGLPIITLDHLGMGDAVTNDCGIKIPLTNSREAIAAIAAAIPRIVADPREWESMSRAAVARAQDYTWANQGKRLAEIYDEIITARRKPAEALSPSTRKTELVSA